MTRMNVSLVCIVCVTIITAIIMSDPINQQNRLARGRQVRYQQAQFFDASMSFFALVAIVLIIALVVLLVVGGIALYRRLIDRDAVREHREYEAYKLEVSTRYKDTQPNFSGIHTLHFSPKDSHNESHSLTQHHRQPKQIEYHQDVPTIDLSPLDRVQQIPTFKEAIERSTQDMLVLGYNSKNEPIIGSLDYLYSLGCGGNTGTGKTSTVVYLSAQSVAHGASLIVVDPHKGHPQSLATKIAPLSDSYLCSVASTEAEMLNTIQFTKSIFDARKSGSMDCDNYIILLCDEWLSLMRGTLRNEFQQLAECITQEGRKYKLIAVFMSQTWNKSKSGDMRNTLASHIVHRTRTDLARQQTGLRATELPNDLMTLKNGQFYLLDIFGDVQKLQAPIVEKSDLEELARGISTASRPLPEDFQNSSKSSNPIGFSQSQEVIEEERGSTTETKKIELTAEEANIVQMFKSGMSFTKITKELSGSTGGRKYTQVSEKVNEVIRKYLQ